MALFFCTVWLIKNGIIIICSPNLKFRLEILCRVMSENASVRGYLALSPWSFNNLNSYSSTKDSLLTPKTHIRNLCMEISEGKKFEWTEKKGREKSWDNVKDTVGTCILEPTVHFILERGEIRLLWKSCSPKEQRDTVSIPVDVIHMYCCWIQWLGKEGSTNEKPCCLKITIACQKNKATELAVISSNAVSVISEHIMCKHENKNHRNIFSLETDSL